MSKSEKCPRCYSHAPHLHPAVQHGGEAQPCPDDFHRRVTAESTPMRIAEREALLRKLAGETHI